MTHPALEDRAETWLSALVDLLEDLPLVELDDTAQRVSFSLAPGQIYLLNWHGVLQQIWLVSPVSGPSHYAFDAPSKTWQCTRTAINLETLLTGELSASLNQPIIFPKPEPTPLQAHPERW